MFYYHFFFSSNVLVFFADVVQKETLIMLPGSTTKVLQEIMELNTTLNACLKQDERSV